MAGDCCDALIQSTSMRFSHNLYENFDRFCMRFVPLKKHRVFSGGFERTMLSEEYLIFREPPLLSREELLSKRVTKKVVQLELKRDEEDEVESLLDLAVLLQACRNVIDIALPDLQSCSDCKVLTRKVVKLLSDNLESFNPADWD